MLAFRFYIVNGVPKIRLFFFKVEDVYPQLTIVLKCRHPNYAFVWKTCENGNLTIPQQEICIVRFHIGWRGERNITYKGVELPNRCVLKP